MEFYLAAAVLSAILSFASMRAYWIKGEDSARHETTAYGKFMLAVFAVTFLSAILFLAFYMEAAT